MKLIKVLLIVLGLLTAGFFLTGLIVPQFSYQSKVIVNKPVDHAFAVFVDPGKMGEWLPNFKSMENISGSHGEIGSKWKLTVEEDGKIHEMIETTTGFKENEMYSFFLENEVMNVAVDVIFSEINGQTEITANNTITGNNLVWKSLFPFFKSMFINNDQKTYEKLRDVIESSEVKKTSESAGAESSNETL